MFSEAFTFARLMGVKTCLGTEAPLTMPKLLQERLKARGKDSADPAVVRQVYEGIFGRIMKTHPLDYYWIWTDENWTWKGNTPEQLKTVIDDIKIAREALKNVGDPFKLATAGWVLGPASNRSILDEALPRDIELSAISRHVGHSPVDPAFGRISSGRGKWAIPWMEDDLGLTSPQLWVGRIRKDAADALAYGSTGLMGLQWRTRILSPNIAALARAGWDQSSWNPQPGKLPTKDLMHRPGPMGVSNTSISASPGVRPHLSSADFYADWASIFGNEVREQIAGIFTHIDGRLPRPACRGCPAGILPDSRSWDLVVKDYQFVDDLESLRPQIKGGGNLERFDYWLNTFKYLRATAKMECMIGAFNRILAAGQAEKNQADKKHAAEQNVLPAYRKLVEAYQQAFGYLLASVNTQGGLATIIFWEQTYRPIVITETGRQLAEILGRPLPKNLQLPETYTGRPRLIVPTQRTTVRQGESITLKIIVLDQQRPNFATLYWRPMGPGAYRKIDLHHVSRAVYSVALPSVEHSIEYYIRAETAGGSSLVWPATAPEINSTLVVIGK